MKLLAIDTAANLCAACVFDVRSESPLSAATIDIGKGHVEHLIPLVEQVLAEAGIGYPDLGRIAVNVGPGSFTGVRVGVAAARGFSLALGIPAIGISSLDSIAADAQARFPKLPAVIALDARRGEVYTAIYDASGSKTIDAHVSTISAVAAGLGSGKWVLAGSAADAIAGAARGSAVFEFGLLSATGDITTIARLGARAVAPGQSPVPLYLRPPDAKPQSGFAVARAGR